MNPRLAIAILTAGLAATVAATGLHLEARTNTAFAATPSPVAVPSYIAPLGSGLARDVQPFDNTPVAVDATPVPTFDPTPCASYPCDGASNPTPAPGAQVPNPPANPTINGLQMLPGDVTLYVDATGTWLTTGRLLVRGLFNGGSGTVVPVGAAVSITITPLGGSSTTYSGTIDTKGFFSWTFPARTPATNVRWHVSGSATYSGMTATMDGQL